MPGAARTRSSVRADVVLRAPKAGLPVLSVEVDPGTRMGKQAPKNQMNTVMNLTRMNCSGRYEDVGRDFGEERGDGYYDFADAIPLLVTTLAVLRVHGPLGAARRCGQWEPSPTP
ncbi:MULTISPECIES: hypothetical protein [unclassified Streptomyces]|uniref:hypothetical protein n=1 Tax=unclassified Streptomyces TaxID=2593676 RepID=UPI0034504105